jgi:STE24 endopeptidase
MSSDSPGTALPPKSGRSSVINRSHILTISLFVYLVVFTTAWGQTGRLGGDSAARSDPVATSDSTEQAPVAVPEPSAQALEFYRTGNWLWVLNHAWAIVVPGVLVLSGFSARLRNLAQRVGRFWFLTVGFYVVLFLAVTFVLELPLSYYEGFARLHAYGLSNQTTAKWVHDSFVELAVQMIAGFLFAWVPYLLLAKSPRRWWIYTAMLSVPFLALTMLIKPIWIDPLFNDFGAMKNQELERSILALARQSGIEGSRVFEVAKSVDTNAVNAYVTGLGQTKRIVLWDTLLAKLDEREVLFVMGHEMGHYVLGHVVRSVLLSSIVTLIGLLLVDRVGRWLISLYRNRLGFDSLADIASLPLMLLLLECAFLALSPVALAYSRHQEHEADRFALDHTAYKHSAGMSFIKLQKENLSNPRPGLIYKIFRSSHPSIGERIDFVNSYQPQRFDTLPQETGAPIEQTGRAP